MYLGLFFGADPQIFLDTIYDIAIGLNPKPRIHVGSDLLVEYENEEIFSALGCGI
jgi:hypothetical protein